MSTANSPLKHTSEINLLEYVNLFLKHIKLAVSLVTVCIVVSILMGWSKPKLYRASAQLKLDYQNIDSQTFGLQNADPYGRYRNEFLNTEFAIIRSTAVARKVVDKFGYQYFQNTSEQKKGGNLFTLIKSLFSSSESTEKESGTDTPTTEEQEELQLIALAKSIAGGLSLQEVPESSLVNFTYISTDPLKAQEMANNWMETYIEYGLEVDYLKNLEAYTFLDTQTQGIQEKLNVLGSKLADYSQTEDIVTLGSRGSTVLDDTLFSLNQTLINAGTKLITSRSSYNKLLFSNPSEFEELSTLADAISKELSKKRSQYEKDLKTFREQLPKMQSQKSEIENLEDQLVKEKASYHKQLLNTAKANMQAAQREVEQLTESLENQKKLTARSSLSTRTKYDSFISEMKVLRRQLEIIDAKKQELSLALSLKDIGRTNKTIVERAFLPGGHFTPSIKNHMLLGLFFGLGISIALIFLLEISDRKIHSAMQLEEETGLTSLATIPKFLTRDSIKKKTGHDRKVIGMLTHQSVNSNMAEAFRHLRTSIQLTNARQSKSFLVTSSVAGEGKTITCVNLATAFAQMDKKVIIIDGDLRRPMLAKIFHAEKQQGLVNILIRQNPISSSIIKTNIPNLHLIPSGPHPPNPSELLSSPMMVNLIDKLKESYDFIFIDSPPILAVTDPCIIGNLVDSILLVTKAESTKKDEVAHAINLLSKNKIMPLGVILNNFDLTHASHRYGYQYGYQYGYRYEYTSNPSSKA